VRILLAEDDDDIATLLTDLLSDAGHEVTWVATAAEARAQAASGAWELILTDCLGLSYTAPSADDLAYFRDLGTQAPVILLTGRSWVEPGAAEKFGVSAVLLKPFSFDELLEKIRAVTTSS
jgi:DNA-binding response OmpR family regulator